MPRRTHKAKVSFINDRVDVLNRNAVETFPAKQVFRTVNAILSLVRDKMINNEDSVLLSEYCFNVCQTLNATIQGKHADDLNESVRAALEDLGRVMCEIELTLRRGANLPRIEYGKDKVEEHKLEIQEIFNVLNPSSPPLDENFGMGKRASRLAPSGPQFTTKASGSKSACERLVSRAFVLPELPSLIEEIFLSKDVGDTIGCLLGDDAQAFVDVMDEALDTPDIPPQTRRKCLKSLYRTCRRHALLPKTLKIPVCYDRTVVALYRGGFADVWKGEHGGRDVAVKVLRTYSNSDLQKILGRFCKEVVTWKALRHPNVLPLIGVTMSSTQFAMVSEWMVNGTINDFVKARPDANRLELLGDVARGLVYIHNEGMIHGDLKGANILIDQTGHARVADFGLLTIISDPANLLSSTSYTQGGTARWRSPEVICPERFGLKNSRPTKASDCYALGMVIYETISGKLPFHRYTDLTVAMKVLEGEHPPRCTPRRFTEGLWKVLEQCWASQPNDRPNVEDVLRCLGTCSNSTESSSPGVDPGMETDDDDWVSDSSSSGVPNGAIDTPMTERTPSGLSYLTDRPFSEAVNNQGRQETDLGPPISRVDSNHRDTYQDPPTAPEVIGAAERPDFDIKPPNSYQPSWTQGSPQPLEDGPALAPGYSAVTATQVRYPPTISPSTFWDSVIVPGEAPTPEHSDTFNFTEITPHDTFWKSVLAPNRGVTPAPDYSAILNVTDRVGSPSTFRDSGPNSDYPHRPSLQSLPFPYGPSNFNVPSLHSAPLYPPHEQPFVPLSQSRMSGDGYRSSHSGYRNDHASGSPHTGGSDYSLSPRRLSLGMLEAQLPLPPLNSVGNGNSSGGGSGVPHRPWSSRPNSQSGGGDKYLPAFIAGTFYPPSSGSGPLDSPSSTTPGTAVIAAREAIGIQRKTDQPFACPVPGCGSTFTKHFNLKGHMRSHNEEKPFQCKWPGCGKGFARAHDCKRHEQLHFNYRPHRCESCGKSFQRMDALDRHLRSEGGWDCRRAQDERGEAQVNSAIYTGVLSSAGSVGPEPPGPADNHRAVGFNQNESRVRQLEDALEQAHANLSTEPHPLLAAELRPNPPGSADNPRAVGFHQNEGRVRQLEDALEQAHANLSTEPHPLLATSVEIEPLP